MSDWTSEQLAALHAGEERNQQMRDEGIDPADPAEREAWEADREDDQLMVRVGADPADLVALEAWTQAMDTMDVTPGETDYGRAMRARDYARRAVAAAWTPDTVTCVYCHVTGPAAHFQLTGPPEVQQNWACRQQNLCALRTMLPVATLEPGAGELIHAVLTLVRELAQVAWQDVEARNAVPDGAQGRFQAMLSPADLARLHVVLDAAAERIQPVSGRPEYTEQARAEYGCRTCGAIGREDCTTETGVSQVPRTHGTWGPRWHASRTL
jgi:hypothetical protein